MLRLAKYAKPIADARKSGKRPANLVLISDGQHFLHSKYPNNPVVFVDEEDNPAIYDWWFLAN